MEINFKEFSDTESEELTQFLCGERWEFHSTPQLTKEKIIKNFEDGYFTKEGKRTFWILDKEKKIGVIRLFDLGDDRLDDETPLFDIKITKDYRSKSVGEQALKWLTEFVFTNYPNKNRFEATTRADNIAMRRVFEKCGFVKEAHYRQAWPDENKNLNDCVGYSILRNDWKDKITTSVDWLK